MLKVLYIAGFGRSGSTILDNILNQVDSFVSVGELRYVWDRGAAEDGLCGCGRRFSQCDFWRGVFERSYGGIEKVDLREVVRLRERVHSRHALLGVTHRGGRVLAERSAPYAAQLAKLYGAIQEETGCKVIVDSSKFPSHGYALEQISDVDVYVVHLIRDARAVSFSWMRKKEYDADSGQTIAQQSPLRSAWLWNTWNAVVDARWSRVPGRYLRVRYEDLVGDPESVVAKLLNFVDEGREELPFVHGHVVELGTNHAIAGNPSRFKHGSVTLRLDREWERRMTLHHKALVTSLSWPLLRRYGYA